MSNIDINGSALTALEYAPRRSGLNATRAFLRNSLFLLSLILAIVITIGGFFVPNVFQPTNLANVLRIVSIVGLVALGETLVLLTGEIDLSVGSIMSLSLVVGGLYLDQGSGWSLCLTLMTGLLLGLINGVAVAVGKVPSLIMTLGTLSVYGGLANVVAVGQAKYLYGLDLYLWTGRGYIFGIPVPVGIFLLMILTCFLFQTFSKPGRNVYYTGANNLAAYYSGISVEQVKIAVFGLAGFFAALAGPMYASQTNRVTPLQGVGFELSAIAIAVLGGTSIDGARGSVIGTLIGALIYGFLLNILALSGIGTYMEQVLKGAMLVIIVLAFQKILRRQGSL